MDIDEDTPKRLTDKERRKIYRESVKASPAYQAMKEQQKQQRKQAYQAQKAKQKARAKQAKEDQRSQKIQARQEKDLLPGQSLVSGTEFAPTKLRLVYSSDQLEPSK